MQLYHHPASPNCRKVLAVIQHLGLDVELKPVDFQAGDLKKPEFLKLNPNGKVPVLVDGNHSLWESHAIMAYLCKGKQTTLWPENDQRFEVMRWMSWDLAHFGPACAKLTFERVFKPFMNLGPADQTLIEQGQNDFRRYGAVLNSQLEANTYIMGNELTLADFAVASALTYAGPAQIPVDEFSSIKRWLGAMDQVPAWKATEPKFG